MIEVEGVWKTFPGGVRAVSGVSFRVEKGEVLTLLGLSGCGKTTTLKMLNRLIEPDEGVIRIDGRDIRGRDPFELRRGMGYVIQDVGLLPHWTVGRNVGLVPRLQRWDSARIASRIDEMLRSVGLDPAVFRDRYPRHLSGGQRQRVGVARALAADPEIVLMDEPFGALDPITRGELQNEFLRLQSMIRKTVVLVTHDMFEAVRLSDHLAIMREGRIEQIGPPGEVIDRPSTPFAERFVGEHRDALRLSMRKRSVKESA